MGQKGKTIRISEEQHEILDDVKEHLEKQAKDHLSLGQTGYKPSHVDALSFLINQAEKAHRLQNSEAEGENDDLPEDHPWHPSNLD